MAVSLAFGVVFASVISLFLVPSSYLVLEDLKLLMRRPKHEPAAEPAALASVDQATALEAVRDGETERHAS
jgi:hypothetical protein